MMPEKIETEEIAKACGIGEAVKGREKKQIEEQKMKAIEIPKEELKLEMWNKVFVQETVRSFPFLMGSKTFITREPK